MGSQSAHGARGPAIGIWLRAARPASQSYIALPLLLGQLMAWRHSGELDLVILAWVQLFGLCDQLLIVWGNDFADRATDRDNRTPTLFSGGSRVLPEGQLEPRQLARAARLAALGLMLTAGVLWLRFARPWAVPLSVLALLLLWAYSYRPLRLSYRGGGELLQMLGVGVGLPVLGYYAQRGVLAGFPWALLAVLLPTQLACAIATGLPDEPSDRRAGKHTVTVLFGSRAARLAISALNLVSLVAFVAVAPALAPLALVPGALIVGAACAAAGAPGTRALSFRVGLAVATTLSTTIIVGVQQVVAAGA